MRIREIDIAGNGIGLRLHKPIIDELGIPYQFIRLPDSLDDKTNMHSHPSRMLIIGTPIYKHKTHLIYGIENYPVILCEKPIGNLMKDICELQKYLREKTVSVYVNYQLRFLDIANMVQTSLCADNAISYSFTYNSSARIQQNLPNWYRDFSKGGGVLFSVLPHILDFILFLGNDIVHMEVLNFNKTSDSSALDNITLRLISALGVPITIDIDTTANHDRFILLIQYKKKKLCYDFISDSEIQFDDIASYPNGSLSSIEEIPWRRGFRRLLTTILLNDSDKYLANIADAVSVHQILSQIIDKLNLDK